MRRDRLPGLPAQVGGGDSRSDLDSPPILVVRALREKKLNQEIATSGILLRKKQGSIFGSKKQHEIVKKCRFPFYCGPPINQAGNPI
jgi:hypothetical protein